MTDARLENKLGFDRIRQMISDRCSTDYASKRVEREEFSSDRAEICKRLQLTDEMKLIVMFEESFPTGGYIDCLPFLTPLLKEGSNIDLLSLGKLRTMTDTIRKICWFFRNTKDGIYPLLKRMSAPINNYPEIQRRIDVILDKFGEVKDTASDNLYGIRKNLKEKEAALSKRANAILKKAQLDGITDADLGVSIRDGKYLIPVNTASKRSLPGFVYDESASGKTSFIEPAEIIEIENDIVDLRFAESREIARILYEFSEFLRPYVPDLVKGAEFIGEIDFLISKAQTAIDLIAGMPVLSEDGTLNLRKARHPLLEKALKKEGKSICPLTVTLTPAKHILLISGPNAGGKSVCLKTCGLLQYMFQWGMLIPTSEVSEMPIFDRILVSIGDDQSIDKDLSTYSSFLSDMKEMLSVADSKTLILIDEFGSGTEPAAGGAIAEAILSELDRRGSYGVITTHYTNLKLYAARGGECGVANGAMLFDNKSISPLFSLEIGLPGNSFAFELARKIGLPESIVKDAEERAGDGYVGIERNLRKIERNRRALDEKLSRIRRTDKTLENITDKYQKELSDIKEQKRIILDEAKKEAQEIVKDANKKVENTIRAIKEAQAQKEQTKEARKELQDFMSALQQKKTSDQQAKDEYIDRKLGQIAKRQERWKDRKKEEDSAPAVSRNGSLKVGEKVRIKDNGMVGEISKVSSKAVTVIIGNISSKMPHDKVERISSNEYKTTLRKTQQAPLQVVDTNISERKLNFRTEIDLRGERLQNAIDIVTKYVDDAIMLNISSVRIIHGKGTGVLREELQKYLRTIPGISSVRDEQVQFGGAGVTIVTFD